MVPRAGLEPAQSLDHEILSLARMPISPPRLSQFDVRLQAKMVSRTGIEPVTYWLRVSCSTY